VSAKPIPIYETHDCDLAAYLMFSGLKFIECELENQGVKPRVKLRFFDEKEIARDLERTFMSSEVKRFRDMQKYLLKQIHMTMKGL
jgi:hypothetical protein